MAIFAFVLASRVNTYTLTLDTFAAGDISDYDFFAGTATTLSFFDDVDNATTLLGNGFVVSTFFGQLVDISAGTITGLVSLVGGEPLASVSGWSLDASEVFDLVVADDTVGLRNLLLAGNDTLTLSNLSDKATGGAGHDLMVGLKGNDRLNGAGGDDTLNGGIGRDTLTGGNGEDSFLFNDKPRVGVVDSITDFDAADDSILLLRDIFRGSGPLGELQASRFALNAPGDADDRIIYDEATGALIYDRDGTGIIEGLVFAQLTPGTDMSAADFFLV